MHQESILVADRGPAAKRTDLPEGVCLNPLKPITDERGCLTEIYRSEWLPAGSETVQWNHVSSSGNVLRGVHVHHTHADYLFMAHGVMQLGLVEARPGHEDFGRCWMVELDARRPEGIFIPPGVAHGFFFPEPAVLVYGVSHYWNPADELGCRWDDPELSIPWDARQPALSQRDTEAGSFRSMCRQFASHWQPRA